MIQRQGIYCNRRTAGVGERGHRKYWGIFISLKHRIADKVGNHGGSRGMFLENRLPWFGSVSDLGKGTENTDDTRH